MAEFLKATLTFFTGPLNTVAWEYILLPCVFLGGIFFTLRNRGLQFTKFGYAMRHTVGALFHHGAAEKGAVTPLQAVTTALAATVGTGNIIGTSQAIALGGYGAVFWMWVAALLGMIIKYSEIVLSLRFRVRDPSGDWVGGPMYYISGGMGRRWRYLAALFCVFAALASFGIGNMSQANSIVSSVRVIAAQFFPAADTNILSLAAGLFLAAAVGLISFGGMKRIGSASEKLVPVMSICYVTFTMAVIVGNISGLGNAVREIFVGAFSPRAVLGAGSGLALRQVILWGLRRSAFSNEAGLGSAAIAHAAAQAKEPVQQGLFGIFEVFMDTMVICTLTALAIIVSGVAIPFGTKPGTELIAAAFTTVFGGRFAALFLGIALILFSFTTMLGWSLYGSRCVQYLLGDRAAGIYRVLFVLAAFLGSVTSADLVWDLSDTCNGLMAIPNFIALFALSGVVADLTRRFFRKAKPEPLSSGLRHKIG